MRVVAAARIVADELADALPAGDVAAGAEADGAVLPDAQPRSTARNAAMGKRSMRIPGVVGGDLGRLRALGSETSSGSDCLRTEIRTLRSVRRILIVSSSHPGRHELVPHIDRTLRTTQPSILQGIAVRCVTALHFVQLGSQLPAPTHLITH